MKKSKIIKTAIMIAIAINLASCSSKTTRKEEKGATRENISKRSSFILQFEEDEHNFGSIDATKKKNEFVSKEFVFINNNDKPLIISKADVSCGCISTKIPERPVLKGEKGIVTVTVDTKQLNGSFNKSVYVKSNADNDVELLRVKGELKK